MTALKKALDDFANGYEEVTGDMLPKDLRANVKRVLLAGFLTGLVHSTRIMITTFNEYQGWFENEAQCLEPIHRARYPRSTKKPTNEDLKFLRNELEDNKWRFCPDVYGNGVYVFAG
nr:MAG TPA: hypothetical protein [Caudoviricetes sp.]